MGVLAPGSAHAWPSTEPPIDTSGNFVHVVLEGGGGGYKFVDPQKNLTPQILTPKDFDPPKMLTPNNF